MSYQKTTVNGIPGIRMNIDGQFYPFCTTPRLLVEDHEYPIFYETPEGVLELHSRNDEGILLSPKQ